MRKVLNRLTDRESVIEAGVGLVDVMVAITVLLVVMIPAAYLIDSTVQQTASARAQVTATELAEQELEILNNASLTSLESSLDQTVVQSKPTVAGQTYTVSTFLTWQGVGSQPDLCSSGSPPQSISASAIVTWGTGPINSLAEQSVINPPYTQPAFNLGAALTSGMPYSHITAATPQTIAAGSVLTIGAGTSSDQNVTVTTSVTAQTTINVTAFTANSTYNSGTAVALPDEGFLGVQINGVSGTAPIGVSGVSVQITSTVTGSSTNTFYPDTNGCVYEEELPGTYNVTVSSSSNPPFVDQYESTSPSTTQNPPYTQQIVTAGSATTWGVTFNQGGKVNFAPSGGVPVASGTPVSVGNTGIPTSNWATVVAAGSAATSATLYPFSSSYSVWYGDCLAEEPSSPTTVNATAGGTSSASIGGLANLTVEPVSNAQGTTPFANSTVTATVSDPLSSTDNCPSDVLGVGTSSNSVTSPEAAVVETSRSDTAGVKTTKNSNIINDSAILASDAGKQVTGPNIPAGSYVGSPVTAGVSFPLWKSPVASGGIQNATATSLVPITIVLVGETYSVHVQGAGAPVAITITPGGVVCTSGCIGTQVGMFIASGTALKVLA